MDVPLALSCSADREIREKTLILALKLENHIIGNVCTKFQVNWVSNFNKKYLNQKLKPEAERTDVQTKGCTNQFFFFFSFLLICPKIYLNIFLPMRQLSTRVKMMDISNYRSPKQPSTMRKNQYTIVSYKGP